MARRYESGYVFGCALAAGVMLSAGLNHLLVEAIEHMAAFSAENWGGYPMATFLAGMAFLALFVVEKVTWSFVKSKAQKEMTLTHGDCCHQVTTATQDMSQLQAIIICVAIWLHSVLEGLSLGSATDASGLWTTFAAIAGHKALDGFAFAVGASVVESGSSKSRFWISCFIFAMCTPVGATIGWLATIGEEEAGISGAICNALAAGTFVQIACMEFMPKAFADNKSVAAKCLFLMSGYGLMSLVFVWCGHSHDHQHVHAH